MQCRNEKKLYDPNRGRKPEKAKGNRRKQKPKLRKPSVSRSIVVYQKS